MFRAAVTRPHQPKAEWVEKFKGKFDKGWNALREEIFANQKRLGAIPENAKLTEWPDSLPKMGDAIGRPEKSCSPVRPRYMRPTPPIPITKSAA